MHKLQFLWLIRCSITGGATDLTVVFGWNVVIKSVPLSFSSLLLIFFIVCSTCQVGYIYITRWAIMNYSLGTLIGAFIVDYLGPKYTMVSPAFIQPLYTVSNQNSDHGASIPSFNRIYHEWTLFIVR